jgi:3-hydroxyisobutyrate dehydrogenase-like beta-hydroxyacid dehydrogenase
MRFGAGWRNIPLRIFSGASNLCAMKDKRIGFVGVGRMGANMARRLNDLGYTISAVYDSHEASAVALGEELGCVVAKTPAELSWASDVVFTVVTDDAAMAGLFEGSAPIHQDAGGKVFIHCATVSPGAHEAAEAAAKAVGASTLAASMASSITQARQGTLYLMIGGDAEVFAACELLLKDQSTSLRHVGPVGHAAKIKALVNMVMNINTAGLAEGLGLGAALGLDLGVLKEVFSQTGANSRVLETDGDDMISREHDCFFSAGHAAKDSGIANAIAQGVGVKVPLSLATESQYRRLIDLGLGELDKSAIAELTFPGRKGA